MSKEERHGHRLDCGHTDEEVQAMTQRIAALEAIVRREYGDAFVESMRADVFAKIYPTTVDETDKPAA